MEQMKTDAFTSDLESIQRFRRVLRKPDQESLDELIELARQHYPAMQRAPEALPMELILLSIMMEEHKNVTRLRYRVEKLMNQLEAMRGLQI